ncbi:response regulator [Sulfitobacter sp. LCG007]
MNIVPARLLRAAGDSIAIRIGSLSAILLGALIVSTFAMAWELHRNQDQVEDSTERFRRLQLAAEAERDFGELRYWLTDLSVSLLTLSERRADAARAALEGRLDNIESFAPEAAERIRLGVDDYAESALSAADAYTEDRRVIGNALMAQARQGSDAVDAALEDLVAGMAEQAHLAEAAATQAVENSVRRAMIACTLLVIGGAILTWWILRSILLPLRSIDRGISDLNAGAETVSLPPEGPGEIGRISSAVRALQESQARRRQLETEAERQRMTIMTAIETIPDGFALFDADDRLVLTNERYREMFSGVGHKLVPGTHFREILEAQAIADPEVVGSASIDDWITQRVNHLAAPGATRREMRLGGAWLHVTKSKTPDGGTVAVYSDITGLIEKQAQLEEARRGAETANEAKSRFLASMSHELRTPLNAIIGYSEMLIEDAEDSDDRSTVADLEKIMLSGQHLLGLINDVLDLSKIEAGKMEVHIETFDIAALIEDVTATIRPMIAKNDNTLELSVQSVHAQITTDKTKLRQNLFNLLSNAAKFTRAGRIDLIVRDGDGTIDFAVRDNGIGMTQEQKERLFQAFVQADSSTTRNYGGTGLGLAIVKNFTEMVGGRVSVETEAGKGSTFTLSLPADYAAPEARPRAEAGAMGTVLVIDDDPEARRAMSELLTGEGFSVIEAEGAESGLARAAEHRPDAIVLDIIMPERDGWSVLRELKADPELCEIPVVLVTILGDREMGLAFGAVDHMTKPINPQRLLDTINAFATGGEREVLVVDDDAATRALFRRILVREGWAVRESADGLRALAQLEMKVPSIVVLDLMMPNLDGFETLKAIRARSDCEALPVIIATSKDLSREEMDWLRANAREVVMKGKNGRADLIAALRRQVAASPIRERTDPI